jgi:type 1 glutamine amidotransferase
MTEESVQNHPVGSDLRVAVITGGHAFDLPPFYRMMRSFEGMDVYEQHLENFASSPEAVRDAYDAVVFYTMHIPVPEDDGPWFLGPQRSSIERLFERGQGVVVLHHSILAFSAWAFWDDVVGMIHRRTGDRFRYTFGLDLRVEMADRDHPITAGLEPFRITDEGYRMDDEVVNGRVLLTVDHPDSMPVVGWVRRVGCSRVFCDQLGHDAASWENPSFREILRRGIFWTAKRL